MGKKGGKGKKGAKIIDGLATNEMNREQLAGHVKRLQMELDREREERNFFSLEREKLFSLWNMTLEQIGTEKHRNRLMEVQVAEGEKEKEEEMSIYKQKLRYLMMEQSKKLAGVRLNHLEKLRRMQEEARSIHIAMQDTLVQKKRELSKAKSSIHEIIRGLKINHSEAVTQIGNDYGREIRRLESEFNRRLFIHQRNMHCDGILGNLNLEKKEETEDILALHETLQNDVEELKSNENRLLMEIKKMKGELNEYKRTKMKKSLHSNDNSYKTLETSTIQNKDTSKLEDETVNMNSATITTHGHGKELEYLKQRLRSTSKVLKSIESRCRALECENETLMQRTALAEKERDDLKSTFATAIIEMQRKASMSKLISELKLNALSRNNDKTVSKEEEPDGENLRRQYFKDLQHTQGTAPGQFRFRGSAPNQNSNTSANQYPNITINGVQGLNTSGPEDQEEEYLNNLDSPSNT